jgi:hypothetical protein
LAPHTWAYCAVFRTHAQLLNSCPGVVKDLEGACCPDAEMDNSGRCCPSGQLDACGVCGGYSLLVDIQGERTSIVKWVVFLNGLTNGGRVLRRHVLQV